VLEQSLRMMHPFLPFVTEELWQYLSEKGGSIGRASWPIHHEKLINKKVEEDMQTLIDLITAIRNARAQWHIKPQEKIDCYISASRPDSFIFKDNSQTIAVLIECKNLRVESKLDNTNDCAIGVVKKNKFAIPLTGIIDIAREKQRILHKMQEQSKISDTLEKRLRNREFLKKAPVDVVCKERQRLESITAELKELKEIIRHFN